MRRITIKVEGAEGIGKSTILKAVLRMLLACGMEDLLCKPNGHTASFEVPSKSVLKNIRDKR